MIGRYNKVINKMMNSTRASGVSARQFSSQLSTSGAAAEKTQPAISTTGDHIKSIWNVGKDVAAEQAAKDANEAAYLDTLKKASTIPGAFNKLSEESDSAHISNI